MSTLSITKLYEILSNKIGKEPAENLTLYIEEKISNELEKRANGIATKEDISSMKAEIALFKAELLKWMLFFSITQVGITSWLIIIFLKK